VDIGDIRKYGFERSKREKFILDSKPDSDSQFSIQFMNKRQQIPVITSPIGLPIYRIRNGRTVSLQEEYVATHDVKSDFFVSDYESQQVQLAQHELLLKLAEVKQLESEFRNPDNKQSEPIICTKEGVIVNGNRRLSVWRKLYYNDPEKYKHFQYIELGILPNSDENAIERLEVDLQLKKDIKGPYSWHAQARLMIDRRNSKSEDIKAIAEFFKTKPKEVDEFISMHECAERYLHSISMDKHWSAVDEFDFVFRPLVRLRKKMKPSDMKYFEEIVFAYIQNPGEGRLYAKVGDIFKQFKEISEALSQEAKEIVTPVELTDDERLLLGTGGFDRTTIDRRYAREMLKSENHVRLAEVIDETIESGKSKTREMKSTNYIRDQIVKSNTCIQNALRADKSRHEISTVGVLEQLNAINDATERLRKWVSEREDIN